MTPIDAHRRRPEPAAGARADSSRRRWRTCAATRPVAFRTQERAVTPDDYARMAERHPQVQRAAATFRWTGSWHTVFVTADPLGGQGPRPAASSPSLAVAARAATAWPATTSRSTRRASCRSRSTCRCAPSATTSAPTSSRRCSTCSARAICPTAAAASSTPTTSRFGQPVYLVAALRRRAGGGRRRVGQGHACSSAGTRPIRSALADGQLTFDRLEIAQLDNDPEPPRARRLPPRRGRGQVDGEPRPHAATTERLRLLRRHHARRRPAASRTGPASPRSPTGSARWREFKASLLARLSAEEHAAARTARPRAPTTTSRSRCSTPARRSPTCSPSTRSASPTRPTCAPPPSAARSSSWRA